MKVLKKILFLSAQLLLPSLIYPMHYDDKTEADRIATIAAYGKTEKSEQADDSGSLAALGNPTGKSVAILRDEDNKATEGERALQQGKDSTSSLFFNRLPVDLQLKVMTEYYHRAIPQYVLRHQRELAPIILSMCGTEIDADSLLKALDTLIVDTKEQCNWIIRGTRAGAGLLRARAIIKPDFTYGLSFAGGLFPLVDDSSPFLLKILGFSDRTYMMKLNPEQLKNLMNSYSFEQISFFVSLAKIKVTDPRAVETISLSSKDCALFKNLDSAMQARLQSLYPWIDFYTPNDCALSIDDRMQWIHHKLVAHTAYWLRWAKGLPYFCRNVNR